MASFFKVSVLLFVSGQLLMVSGLGGPSNRRRGKQNELAISFEEQDLVNDEDLRDGRQFSVEEELFPFVGGDRADHLRPFPSARHDDERSGRQRNRPRNRQRNRNNQRRQQQQQQTSINAQQGSGDDATLNIGEIAAAGERCIDKVVMIEETEYDEEIECHHSYSERCHTTYTTDFEPQQEEECSETFRKNCFIEYKKIAFDEPVRFCHTPLVCDGEGPIECKTVYESQCETRYHEHDVEDDVVECETIQEEKCVDVTQGYTTEQKCTKWPVKKCKSPRTERVKKYSPETDCKKVPRDLCGPSGCVLRPGPEECFDKKETIVQEVPEETCSLEPNRECKHVTKLVPLLKPQEECVDIPKEVCSRSRKNPRKIQKPVVKKWCYVPSAQSGLLGLA